MAAMYVIHLRTIDLHVKNIRSLFGLLSVLASEILRDARRGVNIELMQSVADFAYQAQAPERPHSRPRNDVPCRA